jgi:hypothetical protein
MIVFCCDSGCGERKVKWKVLTVDGGESKKNTVWVAVGNEH